LKGSLFSSRSVPVDNDRLDLVLLANKHALARLVNAVERIDEELPSTWLDRYLLEPAHVA
jgi:hypothetical protein